MKWFLVGYKLPEVIHEDICFNDSKQVLFYTSSGEIYKGCLRCIIDEEPFWVMQGPDGYTIENVIAWAEIEPPDFWCVTYFSKLLA